MTLKEIFKKIFSTIISVFRVKHNEVMQDPVDRRNHGENAKEFHEEKKEAPDVNPNDIKRKVDEKFNLKVPKKSFRRKISKDNKKKNNQEEQKTR